MARRRSFFSVTRVKRGFRRSLSVGRKILGIRRRRTKSLIHISRINIFSTRRRKNKSIFGSLFNVSKRTNSWRSSSNTKKAKKEQAKALRSTIRFFFSPLTLFTKKSGRRRRK